MPPPLDKESDEYKEYCRKKSKCALRRWEDPEERRKQSESASKSWENEDIRKSRIGGTLQSWNDDDVRISRISGCEEAWENNLSRREKQSAIAAKRWEDPEERKKQASVANKRWEDPKERESQRTAISNSWADKSIREARSVGFIKGWEDPTRRESQCLLLVERLHGGIWYGNITYSEDQPYCEKFNSEFKERVRAFREYVCFECGAIQDVRKLSIHHVHYDKKMCCNGSPQDVVPLCTSCHTKTNCNRDYWEDHFTEMIYENDPMGKCFFTKEEMKEYKKGILK